MDISSHYVITSDLLLSKLDIRFKSQYNTSYVLITLRFEDIFPDRNVFLQIRFM